MCTILVVVTIFSVNSLGSSPYTFVAGDGVTRVKVLPNPSTCEGRRRPLVFRLD